MVASPWLAPRQYLNKWCLLINNTQWNTFQGISFSKFTYLHWPNPADSHHCPQVRQHFAVILFTKLHAWYIKQTRAALEAGGQASTLLVRASSIEDMPWVSWILWFLRISVEPPGTGIVTDRRCQVWTWFLPFPSFIYLSDLAVPIFTTVVCP